MATNDKKDFDDENYDPKEMEKIIKEVKEDAYTDVLKNLKFDNKLDEMVFNLLPLSKKQKEELVMACAVPDDVKDKYEKIKKLKTEIISREVDEDIVQAITGLEVEDDKKDEWKNRLSPTTCSSNKDDKSFYNMIESIIEDDLTDEE